MAVVAARRLESLPPSVNVLRETQLYRIRCMLYSKRIHARDAMETRGGLTERMAAETVKNKSFSKCQASRTTGLPHLHNRDMGVQENNNICGVGSGGDVRPSSTGAACVCVYITVSSSITTRPPINLSAHGVKSTNSQE